MKIVTEEPIAAIWQTLSRYESEHLAKKALELRARKQQKEIDPQLLENKARALAYCIRNARENIRISSASLTTQSTLNYYGCMWLASAVAVSNPGNDVELAQLERYTKFGHGLKNITDGAGTFPENEYVYVIESGFFYQFMNWCNPIHKLIWDICMPSPSPKSFDKLKVEHKECLVSLSELFARIPELRSEYEYASDKPAKCFRVFNHSSLNHAENSEDELSLVSPGQLPRFPMERHRDYTWLGVHDSANYSLQHMSTFGPRLVDLKRSHDRGVEVWAGKLNHTKGSDWSSEAQFYRSNVYELWWINPLLVQISDPLAIHLMLLYLLSIIARYRPAIWREIVEGSLDRYRILISAYNSIFPRIVPQIALQRIAAEEVLVVLPGSFFA